MSKPFALVIEDNKNLATAFSEAMLEAGYDVDTIHDGEEALIRLAALILLPAVIVLDLHLPGVDGAEILAQIRADERLANTRVIVSTADDRMAESLRGTADLVLIKPVGYGQLRDLAIRLKPR